MSGLGSWGNVCHVGSLRCTVRQLSCVRLCCALPSLVALCRVLAVKVEWVMLRLRGVGKLSFGLAVTLRCVMLGFVV